MTTTDTSPCRCGSQPRLVGVFPSYRYECPSCLRQPPAWAAADSIADAAREWNQYQERNQ